ncbi:MAG: hypothetical protein KAT32_00495 [Candidatus Moranbacteria bacterium]|nr:hypothetical protein [Candidatus Moranbacteria bacterium]
MDDKVKKSSDTFEKVESHIALFFVFIFYLFFIYIVGILTFIFVYDIFLFLFAKLCFWIFSFLYLTLLFLLVIKIRNKFKKRILVSLFISVPFLILFSLFTFIFSFIYSNTPYFYKNNFKLISEENFPKNGEIIEKKTDFPDLDYSLSFSVKVSNEYFEEFLSYVQNSEQFEKYKSSPNTFSNKKLEDANHIKFDIENKAIHFWRYVG